MNQFCQLTCNTCVNINGTNKSVSAGSIAFGQPQSGIKYLISYNDSNTKDCFLYVGIDNIMRCSTSDWTEFFLVDVPSTLSVASKDQFQTLYPTGYSFYTKISLYPFNDIATQSGSEKQIYIGLYYTYPSTNIFTFKVNSSLDVNIKSFSLSVLTNDKLLSCNILTLRIYLLVSQDNLFNNCFLDLQNMLYDYSKWYLSNEQFVNFNMSFGGISIDLMNLYNNVLKKYNGLVNYVGIVVMPESKFPITCFYKAFQKDITLDITYGNDVILSVASDFATTFNTGIIPYYDGVVFGQKAWADYPFTSLLTYNANLLSIEDVSSLNFSINTTNNYCYNFNNLTIRVYLLVSQNNSFNIFIDLKNLLYNHSKLYLSNIPFVDLVLRPGYNSIELLNLFNSAKSNYPRLVNYIGVIVIPENILQNYAYCQVSLVSVVLGVYKKAFEGAVSFQLTTDNKYVRHIGTFIRLDNFLPTEYAVDRSFYVHQKDSYLSIQSAHPNYLSYYIGKKYDHFELLPDGKGKTFNLVVIGLTIKKIENINRYSVNVTINSSVQIWNVKTYFEIKCEDSNGIVKFYPATNYISVISSLQSYTFYNFSAGLKNEFGFNVYGRVLPHQTDEDIPTGYPLNFTVKKVNFTALCLSWAQVESSMRKGIILNYIYSCNNTDSFSNTVDNSTFNVTVYSLNPDAIYNCSVSACTKVGCGLQTFVFDITLVGIPSGPPLNFAVTPIGFSSLLLSWDKVEYSKSNGTIIVYKYSCSNKINTWNTVDNNTFQVTLGNLTFNTTYNCSIVACTRVGCGVQSSSLNTTLYGSPEESATITYISYINSSSINVSWNDISLSRWGLQENQTFCLDIENTSQIVKTECVEYGIGMGNAEISGLAPYTNYTVLVYCKNKAGVGFKDSNKKKLVLTDELAPLISPKNISVVSNNTNSILVRWKPLDPKEYSGVLKGYSILVKAVYSESDFKLKSKRKRRDNLDRQIYNGSLLLEWSANISDPSATYFDITNVFGNTFYVIKISVNTKYQGVYSSGFQTKTKEGVPLVSAVNLQCDIITYDSITIHWESTPRGYLQGALVGYSLFYTGLFQNYSLNADSTSFNLVNLVAFTDYNIVLNALTKEGGGENSQLKCKTDEAVPRKGPTGLTALSDFYPDKTNVSWNHIHQEDWRGRPLGYTISFKLLTRGGVTIRNQSWLALNVNYSSQTEYQLRELQPFSQYSIKIAGYNSKGVGLFSNEISFETCHIIDHVIELFYISLPPFTNSDTSLLPGGVMLASTEQSLKKCGGTCRSFPKKISFVYTEVKKTSVEFVSMSSQAIKLPATVPVQVLESSYSSTLQLPGFVLVFIPNNLSVQLNGNEQMVFGNISTSLATLVMYFLLNCLFGVILFYCQHKISQRKHCFILSGIFEEIYFSIITITTVGFGDKIPLTFCGRVLLIIWTFMGIVLTSICVGNLISALTVEVVSSTIFLYPKENVIAKLGSPEYIWASKTSSINLLKDKNFSSHLDVFYGLKEGQAKYAIFDQYTIEAYRNVLTEFNIKIAKVFFTDSLYYGVLLGKNYSQLQSCLNGLLKDNSAMVHSAMHDFKEETMQNNSLSPLSLTHTQVQLFSVQSPIFMKMLFGMAYTLLSLLIAGGVYEILRTKWNKKSQIAPSLDEKLAYLRDMKDLSEEYLTEFQKMIGRLQVKTDMLLYKHAEQRLKLRNKYSKLYGVNFKYVNLNDLGVSLEQIAEYREDIKRRPKKTRWQRFSEYAVKKLSWLRIKFFT